MSSRLKRRSTFLGETVMFISQACTQIEYLNLPLFEILQKTACGNCCKSLDFIPLCLEKWEKGEDFSLCWESSVEASALPMKKEERQRLKNLSQLLGTSDAAGQKNVLTLYGSYFSAYHERAVSEYEKYGKMYITLSTVMGTGIFILLM